MTSPAWRYITFYTIAEAVDTKSGKHSYLVPGFPFANYAPSFWVRSYQLHKRAHKRNICSVEGYSHQTDFNRFQR